MNPKDLLLDFVRLVAATIKTATAWDGHTPEDAADRMRRALKGTRK